MWIEESADCILRLKTSVDTQLSRCLDPLWSDNPCHKQLAVKDTNSPLLNNKEPLLNSKSYQDPAAFSLDCFETFLLAKFMLSKDLLCNYNELPFIFKPLKCHITFYPDNHYTPKITEPISVYKFFPCNKWHLVIPYLYIN